MTFGNQERRDEGVRAAIWRLARADVLFAVIACLAIPILFFTQGFDDLCQGAFRFRSLGVFGFLPVQAWMLTGAVTAFVVPLAAVWRFRGRREIWVPALDQALLFLLQLAIEAAFAFYGDVYRIPIVGAIFSTWRALQLFSLGIRLGSASLAWRALFIAGALQWMFNLSFLLTVLARNCAFD